jgi:hypothetical protein
LCTDESTSETLFCTSRYVTRGNKQSIGERLERRYARKNISLKSRRNFLCDYVLCLGFCDCQSLNSFIACVVWLQSRSLRTEGLRAFQPERSRHECSQIYSTTQRTARLSAYVKTGIFSSGSNSLRRVKPAFLVDLLQSRKRRYAGPGERTCTKHKYLLEH